MNSLPKYVLTHGKENTVWSNSHAVTPVDVARLKQTAKRPIAVYAWAGATQALMDQFDEIRLITYPLLLGRGTRPFDSGPRGDFNLSPTVHQWCGATPLPQPPGHLGAGDSSCETYSNHGSDLTN